MHRNGEEHNFFVKRLDSVWMETFAKPHIPGVRYPWPVLPIVPLKSRLPRGLHDSDKPFVAIVARCGGRRSSKKTFEKSPTLFSLNHEGRNIQIDFGSF